MEEMWRGGGRGTSPPASSCCKGFPVSAGCGRSSPARGGGPPKVVEGHGRSRVTYKGQETPRVPLHHASQVPLPQRGRIGNVRFPPQRIAANALLQKIPATIPSDIARAHFLPPLPT